MRTRHAASNNAEMIPDTHAAEEESCKKEKVAEGRKISDMIPYKYAPAEESHNIDIIRAVESGNNGKKQLPTV